MMVERSSIGVSPEGVREGDILAQSVVTSVDPRGGGHGGALIDVGLVVEPPHIVRDGDRKHPVYGIAIKNAWGEIELREFVAYERLKVRRVTGINTENGRATDRTFVISAGASRD